MSSPQRTRESFKSNALAHVLIIHEVVDYPVWKQVFDAAAAMRKAAGEHSYQVLCYQEAPNKIVHFSEWSSHSDARRFFQSPELEAIRAQAGVKSPNFLYLTQLESGVL